MPKITLLPKRCVKLPCFPLGTILDELLHAIMEHVSDYNTQDLLNLCLVSRRFYIPAIELLYREIKLDLVNPSYKQMLLFRQLTHPKSRIPERIRVLHVPRGANLDEKQCVALHTLFRGMKYLKSLEWVGPLHIFHDSEDFLELLYARFPQTKLSFKDEDVIKSYGSSPQVEYTVNRLLKHDVRLQIFSLELVFKNADELYNNFKRDLISMLKKNQAITYLLVALPLGSTFPDYHTALASGDLPKLQQLDLGQSSIFTQKELTAWGNSRGWLELEDLVLRSMECLNSLVGRALNLTYLHLNLHDHEDTDDIYQAFESAGTISPFPNLMILGCNACGPMINLNLRFMDFKLLKWVPKITLLQLVRERNTSDTSSLGQGLPTAQHIRDIRQLCPNLETLRVEICLVGRYWKWPFDIIDELARFPKLTTLYLMVNCESNSQGLPRMHRFEYWMLGQRIRQLRRRLDLPWKWPFRIEFISFRPGDWLNVQFGWTFLTENQMRPFGTFGACTTIWYHPKPLLGRPSNLDGSSMEHLESRKYLRLKGVPVWKWRHVIEEIKWRKKGEERVKELDELPTLYDIWTQQEEQAQTGRICAT